MNKLTRLGMHDDAESYPGTATLSAHSRDAEVWLLWTGGWDSTFRLLQLLVETRAVVQPVYVIDPHRPSTLHELRAMTAIRQAMADRIPGSAARIRPTRLYLAHEITGEAVVSEAIALLRRVAHLGGQYDWLARLARDLGTVDLELTIHRDDRAYAFIHDSVVACEDPVTGMYHRVAEARPELEAFRRFRFPILDWTKVRMGDWARDRGLDDILEQTWFCHTPVRGRPCGTCNPCLYAVAEGMGHRLTWLGRLRHRFRVVLRGPGPPPVQHNTAARDPGTHHRPDATK